MNFNFPPEIAEKDNIVINHLLENVIIYNFLPNDSFVEFLEIIRSQYTT